MVDFKFIFLLLLSLLLSIDLFKGVGVRYEFVVVFCYCYKGGVFKRELVLIIKVIEFIWIIKYDLYLVWLIYNSLERRMIKVVND